MTEYILKHTPFADSSTEPPKGSDNDKRSGSMSEDVSGDLSPSISFSKGQQRIGHNKGDTLEQCAMRTAAEAYITKTKNRGIYLPGASIPKGSGTTNSEAPESTSTMADGLSTRKQKQCFILKI